MRLAPWKACAPSAPQPCEDGSTKKGLKVGGRLATCVEVIFYKHCATVITRVNAPLLRRYSEYPARRCSTPRRCCSWNAASTHQPDPQFVSSTSMTLKSTLASCAMLVMSPTARSYVWPPSTDSRSHAKPVCWAANVGTVTADDPLMMCRRAEVLWMPWAAACGPRRNAPPHGLYSCDHKSNM